MVVGNPTGVGSRLSVIKLHLWSHDYQPAGHFLTFVKWVRDGDTDHKRAGTE